MLSFINKYNNNDPSGISSLDQMINIISIIVLLMAIIFIYCLLTEII